MHFCWNCNKSCYVLHTTVIHVLLWEHTNWTFIRNCIACVPAFFVSFSRFLLLELPKIHINIMKSSHRQQHTFSRVKCARCKANVINFNKEIFTIVKSMRKMSRFFRTGRIDWRFNPFQRIKYNAMPKQRIAFFSKIIIYSCFFHPHCKPGSHFARSYMCVIVMSPLSIVNNTNCHNVVEIAAT